MSSAKVEKLTVLLTSALSDFSNNLLTFWNVINNFKQTWVPFASQIFFSAQFFSSQWHQDESLKSCQKGNYVLLTCHFWLTYILVSHFLSYTYLACFLLLLTVGFDTVVSVYFTFAVTCTNLWYYSYQFEKEILFAIPFTNPIWYYIFCLVWTLIDTFMYSTSNI